MLGVALTLVGPIAAAAHPVAPTTARQVVRIAGHVGLPRTGETPVARVELQVLGRALGLSVGEWQVFAPDGVNASVGVRPEKIALQGNRAMLASVAGAREDQRVVLLGEQRPGSDDLYLLAVDLCPPR